MKAPWYREGLRFSCTQCGHCCTGAPGYVWVTRAELADLAAFLGISEEVFARRYLRRVGRRYSLIEKAGGDCVFYDDGCSVYPSRPRQCRTFPFWSENLKSRADWEWATAECPGVAQGRLYSLEEIRVIRQGNADAVRG
jgi:Fe-S-cluster containining protein